MQNAGGFCGEATGTWIINSIVQNTCVGGQYDNQGGFVGMANFLILQNCHNLGIASNPSTQIVGFYNNCNSEFILLLLFKHLSD